MSDAESHSGGCQCGAVRFRVDGPLGKASICHCRMCQKATGSLFAPLVAIRKGALTWTRGKPNYFQSSNKVQRGYCAKCGTPLSYKVENENDELMVGTFDHPESAIPDYQLSPETMLPYTPKLPDLPFRPQQPGEEEFYGSIHSYQHPDHDTAD